MKDTDNQIVKFCNSVKNGFGSISDSSVKAEFERVNESTLEINDLGKLLAILEKHDLLDKKKSINNDSKFYQFMYNKMTKTNV